MGHDIVIALEKARDLMREYQNQSASRDMAIALTNLETSLLWTRHANMQESIRRAKEALQPPPTNPPDELP